jgi:gentisate 1,2-dioxygenase
MLRAGERTKPHRHRSIAIYHVFKGMGFTTIGNTRHDWEEGDTFTGPFWSWHHHGNPSPNEAILFMMNDNGGVWFPS